MNPLSTRKGQMYDHHKHSLRRMQQEAKVLRRREKERGQLTSSEVARLRRVSGRSYKLSFSEAESGVDAG